MKYTLKLAQKDLPVRKKTANKTSGGKCLILAGSSGLWGAAVLCATAAARCGAGYVHLHALKNKFPILKNPDFLVLQRITGVELKKFSAVALGPGLISRSANKKWITFLIKNKFSSAVLDAGALNVLSTLKIDIPPTWILTPHEGELSRMIGIPANKIRQHRHRYVKLAQQKYRCIVLLKGKGTLIADAKKIIKIESGNAALAKAGTGDVLTGMITAFLSQGLKPMNAAALAAYVHGFIADEWIRNKNDVLSLMASDLLRELPKALHTIRKT